MFLWTASRSIPVIALLALACCYLMAAAIFAVVRWAARRGYADVLKGASPVTLTPLAVIFGLFIGFLAADVWPKFERARIAVGREAMGLREALIIADALPSEARTMIRNAVREHIAHVVSEEWPAMGAGTQNLSPPRALTNALAALLSMDPVNAGQRLAQERAVAAIERALDARRQRILISERTVGGIKWFVLLVLAGLVQLTIAMVHVDRPPTKMITMFIFATALAVSALVIMAYDRPFGGGGMSVQPIVLEDVMPD